MMPALALGQMGTLGDAGPYGGAVDPMDPYGSHQSCMAPFSLADMANGYNGLGGMGMGTFSDPPNAADASSLLAGYLDVGLVGLGGGGGGGGGDAAVVYQTVFQLSGPMGIEMAPARLLYPGGGAHVAVITSSPPGCPVASGDVLLSVNGEILVADERQSPGTAAFADAVRQTVSSAPAPRVLRLFRCAAVDAFHVSPGAPAAVLNAEQAQIFMQG